MLLRTTSNLVVLFWINKNVHTIRIHFWRVQQRSLISASSLMNFLYFHTSTDYFIISHLWEPLVSSYLTLLSLREIVVEQYPIRIYVAKDPLLQQCLGFNLAPSTLFFLLSSPSRLCLFHHYVVVSVALGIARSWCGVG